MICKHCGREIDIDSKFCRHCGKAVSFEQQNLNYQTQTHTYLNQVKPKKKYKVPTGIKVGFFMYSAFIMAVTFIFVYYIVMGIMESDSSVDNDSAEVELEEAVEIVNEDNQNETSQNDSSSGWFNSTTGNSQGNSTESDNSKQEDDRAHLYENPNAADMPATIPMLTYSLSFNNVKMTMDAADWHEFIYGDGYYDYGSIDDYYRDSSKGAFAFVPANETHNTANDGIIDIQLDMNHPSFDFTRNDEDFYSDGFEFYSKVLKETDDYVDFSQYDKDGDGYIVPHELTIVFIFAGYEEYEEYAHKNTTYSCSVIYDDILTIDGIKIDECIYTAEKDPYNDGEEIVGIGILCHELGHALDLPDLYDTDYSSEGGVGFHDLMSSGCSNATFIAPYGTYPAPLTAWEREFLGFEVPEIVEKDGTHTVHSRSTDKYNILKIEEGNGYYLIENVDFKDFGMGLIEYIKSPGVAIWYVDKSIMNSPYRFSMNNVNDNDDRYGYMLMEANDTNHMSQASMNYNRKYDHYHYLSGDNIFISDSGITIEILDDPTEEMRVKITIPSE